MPPPTTAELLERVARLEVTQEALRERFEMESQHTDDLMALHKQTHAHEHGIHQVAINKYENQVNLRLDQLSNAITAMRDSQGGYVTRETFDTKFGILEKDVSAIQTMLARIASSSTAEKTTNLWWIGIMITMITIGLNVMFFILGRG